MRRTRVKICGITTSEDARLACLSGADSIGLNFFSKSKRKVSLCDAKKIAGLVPPFVSRVGLFVNPSAAYVKEVIESVPLDILQFHGQESSDFCGAFGMPYIKALPALDPTQISGDATNFGSAAAILLDTSIDKKFGGTGVAFDWNIVPELNQPIIIAGGLNSDNVCQAISMTRPYAVDVSSGVEGNGKRKDYEMMKKFVFEVGKADRFLS
ncbi:MAG: phosphoribosylanthranilate isomerase [Gammaproteobacteria bacterium]|nr:phosphoribosylanthranilate isomerase [Gammaproteobacteria bacterium]